MLLMLHELGFSRWEPTPSADECADGLAALERGLVLYYPALEFKIHESERLLFTPTILGRAKNASFDPAIDRLGGTTLEPAQSQLLTALMRRFADTAVGFVRAVLPSYRDRLRQARASFRPAEIAGRVTSWRKDDTRLHVDSFPATPTGGRR